MNSTIQQPLEIPCGKCKKITYVRRETFTNDTLIITCAAPGCYTLLRIVRLPFDVYEVGQGTLAPQYDYGC